MFARPGDGVSSKSEQLNVAERDSSTVHGRMDRRVTISHIRIFKSAQYVLSITKI